MKKIRRQISKFVLRAPWLWDIKKTGKLSIFILLNIFNSYNMDTKDTLVCNYEILEKILPSLGEEKYLFSISDRFRSWGAEIVRNRFIFYLVIFVI